MNDATRLGRHPAMRWIVGGRAKTSENGLAESPDKTVATVLPTTDVREYVPGNLGRSDRIIQFRIRQQPGIGSDPGTVELELQATVKIQPRNRSFDSPIGCVISTSQFHL